MSHEIADVSIVIVTYNSENDILACLSSLQLNKDPYKINVHLIDNASTDGTISIVNQFKKQNTNKHFILEIIQNETNQGFTVALNQGMKKAQSKYIMVLNPDACLQEGCLSALISTLNSNSTTGVVAPQLLNPDGSIQQSCRNFPRKRDLLYELSGLSYLFPKSPLFNYWKMGDFDHTQKREVDQPQGACLFFPKKVLEKVGFWDEAFPMFFSDVDWCARVKQVGYQVVFDPTAKAVHKKGTSIYRNRTKMIRSSHRSFLLYLKKYRPNFVLVNLVFAIILWVTAYLRVLFYMMGLLFKWDKLEAINAK